MPLICSRIFWRIDDMVAVAPVVKLLRRTGDTAGTGAGARARGPAATAAAAAAWVAAGFDVSGENGRAGCPWAGEAEELNRNDALDACVLLADERSGETAEGSNSVRIDAVDEEAAGTAAADALPPLTDVIE